MAKPCESCIDAAIEEGAGDDIAAECLALMGEDIADHLCDEIETGGEVVCCCPCKQAVKMRLREESLPLEPKGVSK